VTPLIARSILGDPIYSAQRKQVNALGPQVLAAYLITCKGPKLARCSCNLPYSSRGEHDDDDDDHNGRAGIALRGVEEDLDKRLAICSIHNAVEVSDAKDVGDAHDEEHKRVGDEGPQERSRNSSGCVLDLLGFERRAVSVAGAK